MRAKHRNYRIMQSSTSTCRFPPAGPAALSKQAFLENAGNSLPVEKIRLSMKVLFAGLLLSLAWPVAVQAANSFGSVYISEFLADNQHGLKDDDGERSSWIELYNGGTGTVDLNGWYLTDSA